MNNGEMTATAVPTCEPVVQNLGCVRYGPCMRVQRRIHEQVLTGQRPPTVLMVEHPPVVTISQRKASRDHLLATADELATLGIDVESTDRGGDITYHGPGQVVVYPVVNLAKLGLNVGRYMRLLETIVIDSLRGLGVAAFIEPGATGVWAQPTGANAVRQPAKVCAMGIRVQRNVTLHGFALNVDPQMSHFETIVPCGLAGRAVTSLRELLGDQTPPIEQVKASLAESLRRHLAARSEPSVVAAAT